ncbi:MAG: SCO family protein [Comamonas sp.]|nr:SCO family protein [Comamonas sp.]
MQLSFGARRQFLSSVLAGTALAAGVGLSACSKHSSTLALEGVDMTGSQLGQGLALPDFDGNIRHLSDFAGQVVVVFFGYVQCPDVCPTSLQELAEAKALMGSLGERLQGIFISLDPERDTPQVLRAYAQTFDPEMVALTGSAEQIAQVARSFKVFYKKVPGNSPDNYSLDHSAGMYMFNPAGRLQVYLRYGQGAQAIAKDASTLLHAAGLAPN